MFQHMKHITRNSSKHAIYMNNNHFWGWEGGSLSAGSSTAVFSVYLLSLKKPSGFTLIEIVHVPDFCHVSKFQASSTINETCHSKKMFFWVGGGGAPRRLPRWGGVSLSSHSPPTKSLWIHRYVTQNSGQIYATATMALSWSFWSVTCG